MIHTIFPRLDFSSSYQFDKSMYIFFLLVLLCYLYVYLFMRSFVFRLILLFLFFVLKFCMSFFFSLKMKRRKALGTKEIPEKKELIACLLPLKSKFFISIVFFRNMASNATNSLVKFSPLIEKIQWGSMKIEGYPEGKDFKLYPGGTKIFIVMILKFFFSLSLSLVNKALKNGTGERATPDMFPEFRLRMLKIY